MAYRIERIDLFVRETPPARFGVALGKAAKSGAPPTPVRNPLGHVRLVLSDGKGRKTFGCAGDRLSVRWLDKRPGRTKTRKINQLVDLVHAAREIYLAEPEFKTPFEKWLPSYRRILEVGRKGGQEDLTSAFAAALMERAMIDAVCRLEGKSFFEMVRGDGLGIRPEQVHPELKGFRYADSLAARPLDSFHIRHTVGWLDPLRTDEIPPDRRLRDGLPETLEDYIRDSGIRYFKLKVSGAPDADLRRLARIWEQLPRDEETAVTLDANEGYENLEAFEGFVRRLEREQRGLFQHILFIEQPLPRGLSLDPKTGPAIRRIARIKPVIIDEADATVGAYRRARALGYAGTSHKNCKGVFKSLLNFALISRERKEGKDPVLSGEDLQNLPIVPLHQDFTALSVLGVTHCERNGHHYNFGLSMLSDRDKKGVAKHHRDLYVKRKDEWFLNIRDGRVACSSLQCPGFGITEEPDWESMTPMKRWVRTRYPG